MEKCLRSEEKMSEENKGHIVHSSEPLAPKDLSKGGYSSQTGEVDQGIDTYNIEEAESSLREGGCLNNEEARALLGRLEYQRGNVDAALHVFDGIDIRAIMPKIKISISKKAKSHKLRSHWETPPMSIHAISLLFEAIYLKACALHDLGKYKEAAQSLSIILDTLESALPEGLPENFGSNSKLQETINRSVQLLPELWKMAGFFHDAVLSYRRALLKSWNLDNETIAKIQKDFAIFLLYSGYDASPPSPNLRSHIDGSFTPKNNIEEATLLLMILLRKYTLKRVKWDQSIIEHLSFALSVSGQCNALAKQFEELLPGVIERKERYYNLALCYLGDGDDLTALNLLKKILSSSENPNCVKALLLAAKVCSEKSDYAKDGVAFSRRALANLRNGCKQVEGVANCLLGISLSSLGKILNSDIEKDRSQKEALEALEKANEISQGKDCQILYNLSMEYAEQRKLDAALGYAKQLLKMEGQSNIEGWVLLARILSALKRYIDAETIVDASLDQTGKLNQCGLLRTKAKIQIAQGKWKSAVETYTDLIATVQLKSKGSSVGIKSLKGGREGRRIEIEAWYDLANVYITMMQWKDVDDCISKMKSINPYSALGMHATGNVYEAKGLQKEALAAYYKALDLEQTHVPSLISAATVLRQTGACLQVVRSLLTDALRIDRNNHVAWYKLGQLYSSHTKSLAEAAECFQAAALLEESAPVEPFR